MNKNQWKFISNLFTSLGHILIGCFVITNIFKGIEPLLLFLGVIVSIYFYLIVFSYCQRRNNGFFTDHNAYFCYYWHFFYHSILSREKEAKMKPKDLTNLAAPTSQLTGFSEGNALNSVLYALGPLLSALTL